MAGLALRGIEYGVIRANGAELDIAELTPVREKLQVGTAEFRMALVAVLLVMTPGTILRVVLGFQRMDFKPITAVTFGSIVGSVVLG